MQLIDGTQTADQILALFEQHAGACPLITGRILLAVSDSAIGVLRQSIEQAGQAHDWVRAAQIANTLSLIYFERANYFEAHQCIEQSIGYHRQLVSADANQAAATGVVSGPGQNNSGQLATALGNLALIDYLMGESTTALSHAGEAVQALGSSDSPLLRGYLLCVLGAIQCYVGDYRAGAEAFDNAQQHFAREEDDLGMAWWQFIQAREYRHDQNQCEIAVDQLNTALPILREKASPRAAIESLLALSDASICLGNLDRARDHLKQAETLIIEGKRFWHRPEWYLLKAQLAYAENDPKQAAKFALSGLGFVGDQGDLRVLTALYRFLATLLERDRARIEDAQDALDRAIATGRSRARRLHLALALQQAGLHLKHFANRPTVRARSSGFLYEAERICVDMGLPLSHLHPHLRTPGR